MYTTTCKVKIFDRWSFDLDKILEQSLLYDFYGELLNEHQKRIYEDFVLNDLSLSEIAEEQEISRQGVFDIVKRCTKKLEGYEDRLHLIDKFLQAKEKADHIHREALRILDNKDMNICKESAAVIEQLSNEIIDEL